MDISPTIDSLTVDNDAEFATDPGTSFITSALTINGGYVFLSSGGQTFQVNGASYTPWQIQPRKNDHAKSAAIFTFLDLLPAFPC